MPASRELRFQHGDFVLRQLRRVADGRTERRRRIDHRAGHGLTLRGALVKQGGFNAIKVRLHFFALTSLFALARFLALTSLFALLGLFKLLCLFLLFCLLALEGFGNRIGLGLWIRQGGGRRRWLCFR